MPLDIEITRIDPATYNVKLSGMLDASATPAFDRQMEPVLADPDLRIIILELPNLTFISSAGMGSIATIRRTIMAHKGAVVIVSAPPITRVIEITKVLPRDMLFATRKEADKFLATVNKQSTEPHRTP